MSDEIKKDVDVQQNEDVKPSEEVQTQKTFTLEEVQNLLNAKNHEKEARKNA
jgi:hypothetical protein